MPVVQPRYKEHDEAKKEMKESMSQEMCSKLPSF